MSNHQRDIPSDKPIEAMPPVSRENPYPSAKLVSKPYAERQLIIVADDDVVEAKNQAMENTTAGNWHEISMSFVTNRRLLLQ